MHAVGHFLASGLVVWRDTFYSGRHVNSMQFQSIIHVNKSSSRHRRTHFNWTQVRYTHPAHPSGCCNDRLASSVKGLLTRRFIHVSPYKDGPFSSLYERGLEPRRFSHLEHGILTILDA